MAPVDMTDSSPNGRKPKTSSRERQMDAVMATARALFGANFRDARVDRGLTQREVFQATGVDIATISRIERGDWSPNLNTIAKLAAAVSTSLMDLFRPR